MKNESPNNVGNFRSRPGIVLLVTLVLLVVLSTLGYTLSRRLSAQRYRSQYVIDYCSARYGCDSAVKYALATLEDIEPQLISRPNEPDFSDLFYLSQVEYEALLAEWAAQRALEEDDSFNDVDGLDYMNDINDINNVNDVNAFGDVNDPNDPNSWTIPGPYGPAWPLVTEPVVFEIGSAKVRVEIEDENAKYPLGWMLLDNKQIENEVLAGFRTLCEWMDVNEIQIDTLETDLEEIGKIKPFKLKFKEIKKRTSVRTSAGRRPTGIRRGKGGTRTATPGARTTTTTVADQIVKQAADFVKLFHSSLIDIDALAEPTIVSENRKESALKYMGVWGTTKVNINTAPRHVLEAAFTLGGDAEDIAEEIIQQRRIEPFKDIDQLKTSFLKYSDSIRECENYITTVSTFFTIRVTAVSGVAKASAVIAITKSGKAAKKIATISG